MAKKKKSSLKDGDPYAKREAEKYEHPIPSREYILSYLDTLGYPVNFPQMCEDLQLEHDHEKQALNFRLRAMIRDGQIMTDRRNRFCLLNRLNLVKGSVIGHADGFGFVEPEGEGGDLFISARQMRKVMHGDKVLARVVGKDRRGRMEGVIHEVLEHVNQQLVGRFFEQSGVYFVEPENQKITQDVLIPPEKIMNAKSGQVVMVEITQQPTERLQPIGRVTEILGEHMAPGMEIDVAIRAYNIRHHWPEDVEQEVATINEQVSEQDIVGRKDLRDLPLVTIDGADARDFDDAVYCEPKAKGGFRLIVAIADVSHYVEPGSALDEEAYLRGNSVYFPERVIPMLPKILSNGLCSLNPAVDRLCLVCDMSVNNEGKLQRYRFYPAVMHSKARLTYHQVAAMLVDNDQDLQKKFQHVFPHLQHLYQLYQVLAVARKHRGAIEFDTTDTQIEFDEHKKIKQIHPLHRNDAHRLIEECMLLANVSAARLMKKLKMPILFRVHDKPGEERLTALREFLAELGLSLSGGKSPHAKDYGKTLAAIQGRPDQHLIQTVMLRSMSQAMYTDENIGHFGLAYDAYTHFTSPIRRYPDLLLHRAIKFSLNHQDLSEFQYSFKDMHRFGKHCSETERRADQATWDVIAWLKCEYMQDRIGEQFEGVISSVTSFGIFVELKETYVEGLVHVTSLKNDYYQYDSTKHRLMGERTRTVYRLGDTLTVKVVRVDLDDRKIDFELVP